MDIEDLKYQLSKTVDQWFARQGGFLPNAVPGSVAEPAVAETPRVLPEGKRAVRTKTSGDRVYLLDDAAKTRKWVTTMEILNDLGFTATDVVDVDDSELMKYSMASAIYKVDNPVAPSA